MNSINLIDFDQEIKSCKTYLDIKNLIDQYYPNWIVGCYTEYSKDYPQLDNNWSFICRQNNTSKKAILEVSFVSFERANNEDTSDTLQNKIKFLQDISNFLTMTGFVVRHKGSFVPCKICKCAIPSFETYEVLLKTINSKNKALINTIPKVWKDSCINCVCS